MEYEYFIVYAILMIKKLTYFSLENKIRVLKWNLELFNKN